MCLNNLFFLFNFLWALISFPSNILRWIMNSCTRWNRQLLLLHTFWAHSPIWAGFTPLTVRCHVWQSDRAAKQRLLHVRASVFLNKATSPAQRRNSAGSEGKPWERIKEAFVKRNGPARVQSVCDAASLWNWNHLHIFFLKGWLALYWHELGIAWKLKQSKLRFICWFTGAKKNVTVKIILRHV